METVLYRFLYRFLYRLSNTAAAKHDEDHRPQQFGDKLSPHQRAGVHLFLLKVKREHCKEITGWIALCKTTYNLTVTKYHTSTKLTVTVHRSFGLMSEACS